MSDEDEQGAHRYVLSALPIVRPGCRGRADRPFGVESSAGRGILRLVSIDRKARVDQMAASLGLTVSERVRSDIVAVTEVASIALTRIPISEVEANRLTNQGYAISADLGLLMSQVLVRAHPRLTWQGGSGPPDYVSKNLPVLTGFPDDVQFDPILIGTSQAHGRVTGRRGPSAWADAYDAWEEMAPA
jgi:hypothetical protein